MKGSNSTRTALRVARTSLQASTSTLLPPLPQSSILFSIVGRPNGGTTGPGRHCAPSSRASIHTTPVSREDDWDPLTASRNRLRGGGGAQRASRSRFGGGFSREPLSSNWYQRQEPVVETADMKKQQQQDDEFPRNEAIAYTSERIRLVNRETSRLEPDPVSVAEILATLDRRTCDLVQVTPMAQLERNRLTDPDFTPIARIRDNEAEEKQKLQAERKTSNQQKNAAGGNTDATPPKDDVFELQLTWGTTEHDLGHKLKRPKQHLAKKPRGTKVRILVGTKSGKKYQSGTEKEKEALMENIEKALTEDSADGPLGKANIRVRREGPISWGGGLLKIRAEMELVSY